MTRDARTGAVGPRDSAATRGRMWPRMIGPLVFGIAGVAILIWLGVWQVQRLAWKTEMLAQIEERLAAARVAVPPQPTRETDQYRRVRADGTIEPGELHVYTSAPMRGVGYRVIAPLELADGRRIRSTAASSRSTRRTPRAGSARSRSRDRCSGPARPTASPPRPTAGRTSGSPGTRT